MRRRSGPRQTRERGGGTNNGERNQLRLAYADTHWEAGIQTHKYGGRNVPDWVQDAFNDGEGDNYDVTSGPRREHLRDFTAK